MANGRGKGRREGRGKKREVEGGEGKEQREENHTASISKPV